MIALLMGAGMALLLAFVGTPLFIRFLVRKGYGQFIRDDGPTSHHTKRGTPTMGGTVVVVAVLVSYGLTHLIMWMMNPHSPGPSASGLLLLFLMVGMGLVGFLDDFIKISKQRSLGLDAKAKLILQGAVGIIFALSHARRFSVFSDGRPAQAGRQSARQSGLGGRTDDGVGVRHDGDVVGDSRRILDGSAAGALDKLRFPSGFLPHWQYGLSSGPSDTVASPPAGCCSISRSRSRRGCRSACMRSRSVPEKLARHSSPPPSS